MQLLALACLAASTTITRAEEQQAMYAQMAPLSKYMIADPNAEIALARSAAPPSISDKAEIMILGPHGYTTAVRGTNGFVCYVERSWAKNTDAPDFWNPKMRSPNCFNHAAAATISRLYFLKTTLVLVGKSKAEIAQRIAAAQASGELPAPAPGAMCYMMSKQQYLNDAVGSWHSHLMFYAPGSVAADWGANLPGSPLIAAIDRQAHYTVFMMIASHWSDGSPAPPMEQ